MLGVHGLVLYYGRSLSLAGRYAVEADCVLRGGKITGPKNLLTYEARSRGGKRGSRESKQRGGQRGSREDKQRAQASSAAVVRAKPAAERAAMFQKGWATRRAKAAAAQLEAEGRAMDNALAALQERALPKLASLMDELAVLRAGLGSIGEAA